MPSVNLGPAQTLTTATQAEIAPVNTNQKPVEMGQNNFRLLAVAKGVNANAVADTAMQIINASQYSVFQVVMTNASTSLTTATGGVFTAVAAGGTAIVATAALSGLTGPTVVSQRTVASTAVATAQTLYTRIAVAQGAPATLDVYVYGYDLSVFT